MFDNCNTWLGPILWFLGAFVLGYLLRLFMGQSRRKKDSERIAELETSNQSLRATIDQGGDAYGTGVEASGMEQEITTLKTQISDYELQLSTLTDQLKDSRKRNTELEAQLQSGGTMGAGAPSNESREDDLKKIEGVGPNVEKILKKAGIYTWTQLADIQPSKLREILDQEGGRFQYLDPTSWPQQAILAREGKWQELEMLQEELIGGVYYGPVGQYKDADDLRRIEGVGPRLEGLLNNAGIHTWAQLANTDRDRLKEILTVAGGRFKDLDPTSWPQQAALANAGKWDELDALQEELIGGVMVSKKASDTNIVMISDKDDLKIIEGLGLKAEQVLNKEGIDTFEELSQKNPAELRAILDKEGNRFANLDPSSWPQQAWLAAAGRWEDLEDLQDELIGGLYVGPVGSQIGDDLKRIEGIGPRIEGLLSNGGISNYQELADADMDQLNGILDAAGRPYNEIDPSIWKVQARLAANGKWDELYEMQNEIILGIYGKESEKDDLKRIEGIGPKIENLLNDAGITTWDDLADNQVDRLRAILDSAGNRYQIHDPSSWPEQAVLARDGKWTELDKLQEELIGGIRRAPLAQAAPPVKEDLKMIEGIGPKIESLLNDAGIFTWRQLADTDVDRLEEILKAAGDRYRIHDPATWPQQADLATQGKWEELEKLQDDLIGGRESNK